ncbi:L-serine dehydratase [Brevibacterium sanguinis]|uniref:L-serine dehydratase n=2 Tax=Brevibacterium TaxID=1696 RepID=A0A366IHZ6_9MICO|nr:MULTISPECIES: L-serine ammonia-lyase [Brevibacterium]RBP62202.1 L-serine dehydratase [Brevibacterium sanguinis]RBP70666.1 L-serine dehydratase [Brevibacterium celere]
MPLSVFDLFTVGIGPSSSHTVGPMRAASRFLTLLGDRLGSVQDIRVDVFGSLAATGAGHGTFDAILLGLEGCSPETVEANELSARRTRMAETGTILLGDSSPATAGGPGDGPAAGSSPADGGSRGVEIAFTEDDMVKRPLTVLPRHTNAMTLTAFGADGEVLAEETYYSVGGGFVTSETEFQEKERAAEATAGGPATAQATGPAGDESTDAESTAGDESTGAETTVGEDVSFAVSDAVVEAQLQAHAEELPYPFHSAAELLQRCRDNDLSIAELMLANEKTMRDEEEIRDGLLHIYSVMEECASSSLDRSGYLPGGLKVRRRAHDWYLRLKAEDPDRNPKYYLEWVNLIAMAVNEENASGGRVVTAPTNGAAGIIPAVLHYALNYVDSVVDGGEQAKHEAIIDFLLTSAAVGVLYKERASISGAEVGCQGEVGSASSMAAGGLAAVMGGTPEQIENAAEIAMEHNLGLTCDPIAGLVQVPCIERNAIAAGKAINAARMALWGDGQHRVSLDEVIETMRQTGADMSSKYKETALGGLAVNVVEC